MPLPSGFRKLLNAQGPLLGLIGFISLIFFLQVALGPVAYWPYMVVPHDVTVAWHALLEGDPNFSAFVPLLSAAFLHGGGDHLLFNMLFLWIFAALAAELLGHRWMLFAFVFTAICGSVLHVAMNADEVIPALGASGAVMGFEGLYLGMVSRWRLPPPHIWPMARPIPPMQLAAIGLIGLTMDFMGFMGGTLGVGYSAHLGGFVGGIILGAGIVPMPRTAQRR